MGRRRRGPIVIAMIVRLLAVALARQRLYAEKSGCHVSGIISALETEMCHSPVGWKLPGRICGLDYGTDSVQEGHSKITEQVRHMLNRFDIADFEVVQSVLVRIEIVQTSSRLDVEARGPGRVVVLLWRAHSE